MMFRNRWSKLLVAMLMVGSTLLATAGAGMGAVASAAPVAAPGPINAAASCYRLMRESLGTVLPSGWKGYHDQAACNRAAAQAALRAAQSAPAVVQTKGVAAKPDRSECYRALRALGTVLPGRDSSFFAEHCAATAQASANAR